MNKNGSKHLTIQDRAMIEAMLKNNEKCNDIAQAVGKDARTVSREIEKRRKGEHNNKYGAWGKRDDVPCAKTTRYPFVCNGCKKKAGCFKMYKYFYNAKIAQEEYEQILVDSRIGLDISTEDKEKLDNILLDGISKGQSVNHIIQANNEDIKYSTTSIYRLINTGKTPAKRIDLKRAVKLKPRKHYAYKEDNKEIRKGRTYSDFFKFIAQYSNPLITEMDTVESVRNGKHKCLLTLHITNIRFMIAILLNSKTKSEVTRAFHYLKLLLGKEVYSKIFNIILTDRGTEFCNPTAIEVDEETGEQLAHVFFCNSYSSYQKGAIEENHTLLRYVIPKGYTFDSLTQDDVNFIVSNINSYYRDSLGTTPFELATIVFGIDVLNKIGIQYIDGKSIVLNTALLLKKL